MENPGNNIVFDKITIWDSVKAIFPERGKKTRKRPEIAEE